MIEKWAGRLYCHIRKKYNDKWTINDELRIEDVLISIAITAIFYDDSGKIIPNYSSEKVPDFKKYEKIYSLNYYEFWNRDYSINHIHG